MLRWLPLKLTVPLFVLLFAFPGFAASDAQKPELIDALELGLKSPGKVIDLAPYRNKASAISKMGEVDAKTRLKVDQSFGRMPLLFEKNEGQTSDEVKFLSRGRGYNFYLTPTESVMVLSKTVEEKETVKSGNPHFEPMGRLASLENPPKMERAVVRMQVVGANEKAVIKGEERLASTSNYFLGNDKSKWRQGVTNYKKVHYEEVYPGIDLVYYGNQSKLEYDFIVKPGANPNKIELNFSGADKLLLDGKGNLVLKTRVGNVIQHAPVIYQSIDGEKQSIKGKYLLKPNNRVAFHIISYNPEHNLVIDPLLAYSTYFGGAFQDWASDIGVDSIGNVWITGNTQSINFPVTNEAYQKSHNGNLIEFGHDVFLIKLNVMENILIYSTFLGGSSDDDGFSIAVDNLGNAYISGLTESSNFPTTFGAFDLTHNGGVDAFVTKMNPEGSDLIYSTYLGGSSDDDSHTIAIDSIGNAYVSGRTRSPNFPTSTSAYDNSHNGDWDVFISKLAATGNSLVYSTFLGGFKKETSDGLAVDELGNVYLTGSTSSNSFPATVGAYDTTFNGG